MKRKILTEGFFVVGISVGLFVILYPAVQRAKNPKGPHGEMIPTGEPKEANRIFHPSGLSIIAPENWDQIGEDYQDSLRIAARRTPGRRVKSLIMIMKSGELLDINGFNRTTFQGSPAYEKMEVQREYSFDDPALSRYQLYIENSGEWWLVLFHVQDSMQELPDEIRQYIETIKFPSENGK